MNCPKCGKENREGANFCQACGQPLQPYQGPGYTGPGYYYPPYQGYPYNYPPQFVAEKDVVVAILLALMLPGAGHMYAGEVKKGILILASFFIIGILAALAWFATYWPPTSSGNPIAGVALIMFAVIISLAIWIYQVYDAYQTAQRYSDSHGVKRYT
jgi:TM2 domain-containing membrane protein YozV